MEDKKQTKTYKDFGAILHRQWEKGNKPSLIIGEWAEDLNEYEIYVPPQLRDMIVELQNALASEYKKICYLDTKSRLLKNRFDGILNENKND